MALHQRMRVSGDVAAGSIEHLDGRVDFVLEEEGKKMPVSYTGSDPLPDTFKDGAQALVEGKLMPDGRFMAEQVQAKCASKYQATPGQPGCDEYWTRADLRGNSMDIFGSFALLLAFLAAVYAFGAGIAGIITRRPLLTKSARNAGMAVFGLITLAVGSLEYFFFTDNFSLAYVAEHSNRALPLFYKFAALWAGQEGSLLFWSWLLSIYAFSALFLNRKKHPELMPYVGVILAGVQIFFLTLNNFVASPFHVLGRLGRGRRDACGDAFRRQRPQSAAAISGDGDSSADALFGLHGIHDSVCVCAGGAAGAISRREVDSHHAALDDGRVGLPDGRDSAGRALGVRGARLGRLLGLGSGGKCFAAAVDYGHGVFALGDDAGKARDDEGVERLAGVRHVHAVHFGNDADALRRGELGACVRGIDDRRLVRRVPRDYFGRVSDRVVQESRLSAQRQPAGFDGVARVELPVQQS